MKLKYFLLLCVLVSVIFGCGGRWYDISRNNNHYEYVSEKLSYDKSYDLGKTKTSFTGQNIVSVKMFRRKLGKFVLSASSNIPVHIRGRYKFDNFSSLVKADKYDVSSAVRFDENSWTPNSGSTFYLAPIKNENDFYNWAIVLSEDGTIYKQALYSQRYDLMFFSDELKISPDNVQFNMLSRIRDTDVIPAGSFELVFSGKNDVSLNAIYREYTADDHARPAFFQNLTYEPNAKQIRYKDFVIQIDNVSNESITYTITQDGL